MTDKITNPSNIRPAGHRVVILPEEVETVTSSGIIIFTPTAAEKEELAQIYGKVIEVGPECWKHGAWDYIANWLRIKRPWARAGDRVVFGKYAGLIFPGADGGKYRVVNDKDIVAVVQTNR